MISWALISTTAIPSLYLSNRYLSAPGLETSEFFLKDVHPIVRRKAKRLISLAWIFGIPLVVTSGYRGLGEQTVLYEQGRTRPGKIVTNAKPGNSWHNYGLAFDVAILENGTPTWPNNEWLWNKVGFIGQLVGLNWGKSFGDRPHFDYHPDINIATAKIRTAEHLPIL